MIIDHWPPRPARAAELHITTHKNHLNVSDEQFTGFLSARFTV